MGDSYSRVTDLAKLCCKHLYSYCQDAPHSDRLSVTFDAQKLGKALHDGRKAIQPLIDDFVKASAPITLKTGGKGVRFCDTPAKCAHGCAFEIADRLLVAIENETNKKFMQQDGDGSIRVLWGAISHEAADIVNRNAATCNDETEATKPTGTTSKSEQRAKWLAQAMLLVRDNPGWSDAEIARRVGKDKSTLSRSREYQNAAAMSRGVTGDRNRGHITVDPESGLRDVEAYSDDSAERDLDD
ncbi:MAG: hypothetical protein P8J33_05010 [Pirellulaceae bacterium]|nr:hypothetical protein [Pirellulaceae bacterium]